MKILKLEYVNNTQKEGIPIFCDTYQLLKVKRTYDFTSQVLPWWAASDWSPSCNNWSPLYRPTSWSATAVGNRSTTRAMFSRWCQMKLQWWSKNWETLTILQLLQHFQLKNNKKHKTENYRILSKVRYFISIQNNTLKVYPDTKTALIEIPWINTLDSWPLRIAKSNILAITWNGNIHLKITHTRETVTEL